MDPSGRARRWSPLNLSFVLLIMTSVLTIRDIHADRTYGDLISPNLSETGSESPIQGSNLRPLPPPPPPPPHPMPQPFPPRLPTSPLQPMRPVPVQRPPVPNGPRPRPSVMTIPDSLNRQLEIKLAEFKLRLHRRFEESRLARQEENQRLVTLPEHEALIQEHLRVSSVEAAQHNLTSQQFGDYANLVTDWSASDLSDNPNMATLVWSQRDGRLVVGRYDISRGEISIVATVLEPLSRLAYRIQHFSYDGNLWLVAAHETKPDHPEYHHLGPHFLAVYEMTQIQKYQPRSSRVRAGNENIFHLRRAQLIKSPYPVSVDLLSTREHGTFLGIAELGRPQRLDQSVPRLRVFQWRSVQFDQLDKRSNPEGTSIRLFNMRSDIFIVSGHSDQSRGSPVYVLRPQAEKPIHFIHSLEGANGVSSVSHFRILGSNYLLVTTGGGGGRSGPGEALIYWWAGDQFLLYQRLPASHGARQGSAMQLPNGEVLLALLNADGSTVHFYTETTDGHYMLTHVSRMGTGIGSLKLFSYQNWFHFVFFTFPNDVVDPSPTPKGTSSIWRLRLIPYLLTESQTVDPLRSCAEDLEAQLTDRENQLKDLTHRVDHVWVTNKPQVVTAPIVVSGRVNSTGRVNIRQVTIVGQAVANNHTGRITPRELTSTQSSIDRTLEDLRREIPSVVLKNTEQTISGRVHLMGTTQVTQHAAINHLSNDFILNGLPFSQLVHNSLHVEGEQTFRSVVGLQIAGNLKVDSIHTTGGYLNDIRLADLVLLNSRPHDTVLEVTGQWRFNHLTAPGLSIMSHPNSSAVGTINGINPSSFVLRSGSRDGRVQRISGLKNFAGPLTLGSNMMVGGLTNGHNLSFRSSRAVYLDESHRIPATIFGNLTFTAPLVVNHLEIAPNHLINGRVNVTEIERNAVTRSGDQILAGRKSFEAPVTVKGPLTVNGRINGIRIPDEVVTRHGIPVNQAITGRVTFKGPVHISRPSNSLHVGRLNGLDISREAIRLSSRLPQTIVGPKTFLRPLTVSRHFDLYGQNASINGDRPSHLARDALRQAGRNKIAGHWKFDTLVVEGNLTMSPGGGFSIGPGLRLDVGQLPNQVWLRTIDQTIRVPLDFRSHLVTNSGPSGEVHADTINGHRFPLDFIVKGGRHPVIVTGEKIFSGTTINFDRSIQIPDSARSPINGVDLRRFSAEMIRNRPTTAPILVSGRKSVGTLVVNGNMTTGLVNGVNLNRDLMLVGVPQTVAGPTVFNVQSPITTAGLDLAVDLKLGSHLLNGVNLPRFASDVVLVNQIHRPIVNKTFLAPVSTQLIAADQLNGLHLNDFFSRVVTLSGDQVISVPIEFQSPVEFTSRDLRIDSLNNLPLSDHLNRVIYRQGRAQIISGIKSVSDNVIIHGPLNLANGSRGINGINLVDLDLNRVSRTRPNRITAPWTLINSELDTRELFVPPGSRIDGIHPEDLFQINVGGLISGPVRLASHTGSTSFRNIIVPSGMINGCNLTHLIHDALLTRPVPDHRSGRPTQVISGHLTLNGLLINGSLQIQSDLINGVHLGRILSSAVTSSRSQLLDHPMRFMDQITVDNLQLAPNVLVNGLNISFILNDAVRSHLPFQVIHGAKTFRHGLATESGRGKRQPVNIGGNLWIGQLINGMNMTHLAASLVRSDLPGKVIVGQKTFIGPVTILGQVQFDGRVAGLNIPQDLVPLSGSHELISHPVVFQRGFTVQRNLYVAGPLDGVDLTKLLRERINLNGHSRQPQVIYGSVHCMRPIQGKGNLIVNGTINGIPIGALVHRRSTKAISGRKIFTQPIQINGHLLLTNGGLINGVDPLDVAQRAISVTRPETIQSGTLEFAQPLRLEAPITISGSLNGFPVNNLSESFRYYEQKVSKVMSSLQRMTQDHEQAVSGYFDYQKDIHPKLKYVKLASRLPPSHYLAGPVERFSPSPFYYPGRQNLKTREFVAWIPNQRDRNRQQQSATWSRNIHHYGDLCRDYTSLTLSVAVDGRLTEMAGKSLPHSRYFPSVVDPLDARNSFLLVTNSTSCRSEKETSQAKTLMLTTQTDLLKPHDKRALLHGGRRRSFVTQFRSSPYMTDARMFRENGNQIYVVAAFEATGKPTHSVLYRFDRSRSQHWKPVQEIDTFGAHAIDLITVQLHSWQITFLAVASRYHSTSSVSSISRAAPSQVFLWNAGQEKFNHLIDLNTFSASSVLWVEAGREGPHEPIQVFLLVANERAQLYADEECLEDEDLGLEGGSVYTTPVQVYEVEYSNPNAPPKMELLQSIGIPGVVSMDKMYIGRETYVVAASRALDEVHILQLRGFNLFQTIQKFSVPQVDSVRVFETSGTNVNRSSSEGEEMVVPGNGGVFIAVASRSPGASAVYRVVISGPVEFQRFKSVEQLYTSHNAHKPHH